MRVWGEDSALLTASGVDVAALEGLERDLAAGLRLPEVPRADVHVHLGRDADGHALDAATLVADLDRWDVARAVCFPANEPGPDGDFGPANAAVAAAARANPGRIVPFCRVDPARGAAAALDRAAADGARGLKLHPVAQRFALDGAATVACVSDATARGWPVLLHAGFGARALAGPLARLLEAVPAARLILAHGARGDARAVFDALGDHPGVRWDTSLATLPDLVLLPPERLLFGSDRPYGDHATALMLVDRAARVAGWDAGQIRGVLGGNLARLLGGRGMNPADSVRLVAALAAVEMCLVRRDPVAGPLLAQAARAAEGLEAGPLVRAARDLLRDAPDGEDAAAAAARRKVVQALCRAAAQQAQFRALGGA